MRRVFELSVAEIVPEPSRRSLVGFGRAVRLMRAIERAIKIRFLGPLHIVGNHEIEFAVAIVIDPSRAGRELVRPPQSCRFGDIGESAVAVVVEEMALADSRDEDVVEPVVVIIADGNTESEERNAKARFARHIRESAIVVVVVELERSRTGFGVSRPILAVDEQNVRPTVIVVIDERATWTHGFRQPFLPKGSVVVSEVDASLRGDVAEGNALLRPRDTGRDQ